MQAQSQFIGHSGVYFLGSANVPISTSSFSNPNINGAVVRFSWNDLEPSPGNFNWTFIDGEIAKAVTYNKKVSLQPLGIPNWL
ncbi:MAG: beta-galactosidase, partial [Bacteroidota bacterium]